MSITYTAPIEEEFYPLGCRPGSVERVFVDGQPAKFTYKGGRLFIRDVHPERIGGSHVVVEYKPKAAKRRG